MVSKQQPWMFVRLAVLIFIVSLESRWSEGCLEQERFALLQLKPFFNYLHYLDNWVEGVHNSDCCQWDWVECNNDTNRRVISLNLYGARDEEMGEWYLNASLFSPFQQLQTLYLSDNGIAGCVENEGFDKLSTLRNLEALYLDGNSFNNSILSSLSTISSLKYLSLYDNKLKGIVDLQEIFDSLSKLEELDLSSNHINKLVVTKDNGIAGLKNLQFLGLGNVRIQDGSALLQSLGLLPYLKRLDLSYNNFSGNIISTRELHNFTNLEELTMHGASLHTSFLQSIAAFTSLETLDMEDCQFNGIIGTKDNGIIGLKNLQFLSLRNVNILDGSTLLQSLGSLPYLKRLDLSYNNFRGNRMSTRGFLQSIAAFTSLETLDMGNCQFNGIIGTKDLSNLKNLKYLSMGRTNLNISFLRNIGPLTSLQYLSLGSCDLKDTLPDQGGLCELKHLQELDLSDNNLRGSLPWCFGNLTSLQVLYLSSNQFSGNISPLGALTSLEALDLPYNQFSGNISPFRTLTSIQQLYLSSNQFSGNISPLRALSSIQELYLSYNHFQIPISLEPFFNHSKLKSFTCKNNDLYAETELYSLAPKFQLNSITMSGCRGTFPKFLYHQHDLQEVDLSHNNFTGVFPDWLLENNTQLQHLLLLNNSLTGPLPLPIHSHVNLMTLDISMNNFNGHIPAEVAAYLPGLTILNMSKNAFEGNIPSSIGDMKSLISLDLSNNHLSGEIPEHLAEGCFSLQLLALSNNRLQGQIFSSIFNLTYLDSLQLDGNHFHGKIPDSLSNTSLYGLYLSDNQLSGKIPGWLGNMSSLIELVMPNNHLEGPIPPEFCQLENLQVLNLAGNSISNIPYCLSPSSLKQVHLSRNMLQGELQDSFHNSSSLVTLDLGYNHINGSIPNWIGRLINLTYLILNNNNLQGRVPIQLCQLDQLRLIDLSHNNLFGHIPYCLMNALRDRDYVMPAPRYYESDIRDVGATSTNPLMTKEEIVEFRTKTISYFYRGKILSKMSGIDLSCNKLTGIIPPQIGNLTMIHTLNLSHNNLIGSIPSTFLNLKQIESLDLSYNNLSGIIPHQLVELSFLAVFSVAYNNLSGRTLGLVAQFSTFNASSYEGNPLLCGLPLPKSCDPIESPMLPTNSSDIGEESDFMGIFYISFTVSYAIMLLTIVFLLFINPYWRRRWFYVVETWMTSFYYFVVDHLPKCHYI